MVNFKQIFRVGLPIIQAPMAGVQGSELAIAVCNAGGLGSLPCGMLDSTTLAQELENIQAKTRKPYNVNFFCHPEPQHDQEIEAAWKKVLSAYYKAYDIDITQHNLANTERRPFNQEMADILEKHQPAVVSFHFGLPSDELLARIKAWGAKIISTATTIDEAVWLSEKGVDAIIAQGLEAGGHRGHFLQNDLAGQMDTFSLLPQIMKAVDCPVIAAGGIANKQGVQAALQLGAIGVQVGTAYLLCTEARTRALHRAAIKMAEKATAVTNLFSGRPARGIMNKFMQELGPMNEDTPPFPLASSFIAQLRHLAEANGRDDFSPLWCGQNREGCKEVSAAELTRKLCDGLAV